MTETTYPYPQRASEFVKDFPPDLLETRSVLTEGERNQVLQFEEPLFRKLTEAKSHSIEEHVIYPEAFTTDEGKKLFAAIYLDPKLRDKITAFAPDWEKQKDKRPILDKFFDNLPNQDGSPRMGDVTTEDIEKLFDEADLTQIPDHLGDRMNTYSSKWAEEKFKKEFLDSNGNLDVVPNPRRIRRVANPEAKDKKIHDLRELKSTLKEIRKYLANDKGNVPEAKRQVCDLYQRYINVLLAEETRSRNLRRMERMDHFLKGVGLEYGETGLLQTIPGDLAAYCEQRLAEPLVTETPDFIKYNAYMVNADQTKELAEKVLAEYGLSDWKAVVLERNAGLAVMFDKKKGTREVRIPKDFKRGIVTTLGLLAHEIEGHVLRYANRETSFKGDLLFTQDIGTGRSGVLSEGSAMWLEDKAKQEMVGMKDPALPYYYVALKEKQKGGSFKECVKASYEARIKREPGLDPVKTLDKAYSSTQRIFRRFTNYDDKSGYIPISETLDYIEQEIVVDFLMNHPGSETLSKLLFVAGIDLYSIGDLLKIGFLDLSQIQEPRRAVTKKIWPEIKEKIDSSGQIF